MNQLEKNVDEAVARQTAKPFCMAEHIDFANDLAVLEDDLAGVRDKLRSRYARGGSRAIRLAESALGSVKSLRAEMNTRFLMESRTQQESPYYGGEPKPERQSEPAVIPGEGADHGDESEGQG